MLNNIGLPGLLLIAVVVLVLFGRGKISSMMGEVGKGITAFKRQGRWTRATPRRSTERRARRLPARDVDCRPSAHRRRRARAFGRGKISLMGEVGKGITAFKKGMDDGRGDRGRDDGPPTRVRPRPRRPDRA